MKKFLSLSLILAIMALVGCGNEEPSEQSVPAKTKIE